MDLSAFIFLLADVAHSAYDHLKAEGLCYRIEGFVNALVDYTTTQCIPTPEDQKKDLVSFILVSGKPIFHVEAAKKGWLVGVVAAVGKVMRDNPKLPAGKVIVTDTSLLKQRIGFWFEGELTKSLQKRAYDGTINVDELYRQLNAHLRELTNLESFQSR